MSIVATPAMAGVEDHDCLLPQDRDNSPSSCAGLFIASHIGFDWPGVWVHLDIAAPVHAVSPGHRGAPAHPTLRPSLAGQPLCFPCRPLPAGLAAPTLSCIQSPSLAPEHRLSSSETFCVRVTRPAVVPPDLWSPCPWEQCDCCVQSFPTRLSSAGGPGALVSPFPSRGAGGRSGEGRETRAVSTSSSSTGSK